MTGRGWIRAALAAGLAGGALLIIAAAPAADGGEVAYPEGFRAWTHVATGLIGPAGPGYDHFGGMHSIYANRAALAGYRTGRFPDGSVLVFDLLAVRTKDDVTSALDRRLIDVMVRDSRRFAATGGWGYGEFRGSSRTERTLTQAKAVGDCHACHAKARQDGVFSRIMGAEAMPTG